MRIAQTLSQVAQHFGKHPSTAKSWVSQGMPPKSADGYDLDQISRWLEERQADPHADLRAAKLAAEIELKQRQCEIAKLKAEQLAHRLIDRKLLERLIAEPLFCAADALRGQGDRQRARADALVYLDRACRHWISIFESGNAATADEEHTAEGDSDAEEHD